MPRRSRLPSVAYDIASPNEPLPDDGAGGAGAVATARPRLTPSIDPFSARGAAVRSNALKQRGAATYLRNLRPSADPRVNALRQSMIDSSAAGADLIAEGAGQGANYFQNRDLAADANRRSNDLNVANVGLIGSAAGLNDADAGLVDARASGVDAETRHLLPARVALTRSQGANLDAQTATEDATRGVKVGQGNLQIAQGRALLPTMGEAAANEVAAGRMALAERRALLPGQVARQAAETGALTAQADASRATLDPAAGIAADKAAFELSQQMADQEYGDQSNWRYALGWLPGVDSIKGKGELTQKHFQRLRPSVSGEGGGGGGGSGGKKVVRRGREKGTGRTVVEYSDGTRAYAS